jgi:hypothetical protein
MSSFQKILMSIFMFSCMNSFLLAEDAPDKNTMERYQSIIDRAPFGVPPPDFNPKAPPGLNGSSGSDGAGGEMTPEQVSAEEAKIISEVQVSVLSLTPGGDTMVGFTDKVAQNNYYLKTGCEKDGWTVVSADAASQSVVLSKGGVEATVQVGASSSSGKSGDKKSLRPSHSPKPHIPVPALASQEPAAASLQKGLFGRAGLGGAMSRLSQRRLAERNKKIEADRLRQEKEELEKKENQQLRDKVRAMEEKAEQDAIEREETKARLLEFTEALKRNREKAAAENDAQEAVGEGE